MKAPKLVKKANSRSQSQLQVGKCNFIEIPTGVLGKVKKLLSLSLEHTYTINYSCQIIESLYLQYLGYTTLTVKSQE